MRLLFLVMVDLCVVSIACMRHNFSSAMCQHLPSLLCSQHCLYLAPVMQIPESLRVTLSFNPFFLLMDDKEIIIRRSFFVQ